MTIDPDLLHRAMLQAAYLVERYGDKYAYAFERLADAWDELQRKEAAADRTRDRARRLLAAHTINHDQASPSGRKLIR